MVCPPRNLAFRGSMGRSGAFAEFGQASTPRTPPAFWALVEGYYVRQKASGQLVENAFGDFCGCALIAKKADDAALHIYQTNIQYHTPLPSVLMLRLVLIHAWLSRGSAVSDWLLRTQITVLGGISHPFLFHSNSSVT